MLYTHTHTHTHHTQDAFIWDLKKNCGAENAETFAQCYVNDLELPSEMVSVVAHAIRDQVLPQHPPAHSLSLALSHSYARTNTQTHICLYT